jgi:hypothetical protein
MDNTFLYNKLATLPEHMRNEVADFIDFLVSKAKKGKNVISSKPKPKFGSGKGMFKMHADFDAPLEDFKDYVN